MVRLYETAVVREDKPKQVVTFTHRGEARGHPGLGRMNDRHGTECWSEMQKLTLMAAAHDPGPLPGLRGQGSQLQPVGILLQQTLGPLGSQLHAGIRARNAKPVVCASHLYSQR